MAFRSILKSILSVIFSTCILCVTSARENVEFNFEHLTTDDGLSHNSIIAIAQDSMGVMWIGTRYGLNSYDGSHVRTYTSSAGADNILMENQIRAIRADRMKLYIQTLNYLTIYDIARERFENIYIPNITSIDISDSKLWVATVDSIFSMSLDGGDDIEPCGDMWVGVYLSAILACENSLYVGTNDGLFRYDRDADTIELVLKDVTVMSLYKDRDGNIWVSTSSNGAYKIGRDGVIENIKSPTILHNYVRAIHQDSRGDIWIGTFKGLDQLDCETGQYKSYEAQRSNHTKLSHNSVWSLFCDDAGRMWAGTYFGGVNILDTKGPLFRYYVIEGRGDRGLFSNVVGGIVEGRDDNIYMGLHGGGVVDMDLSTGEYTYYTSRRRHDPYSIGCNNIQDIMLRGDNEILFATNTDGVNLFDIESKRFRTLVSTTSAGGVLNKSNISDVEPYGDKYIISTQEGVYLLDVERDALEPLVIRNHGNLKHLRIKDCEIDCNGQIWIGSESHGLYRYNPDTGEMKRYSFDPAVENSLSSNEVNNIYQDRALRMWISTPSGLDLYRPESDDFVSYGVRDGLPSNTVYEVIDAGDSDLLVTTKLGVTAFSILNGEFRNFTQSNGMPLSEITTNSLLYTSSGDVYVGGYNGMMSFREDVFRKKMMHDDNVRITSLSINNNYVGASDSLGIIDRNIRMVDVVKLNHKQNSIRIEFSDMSMTNRSRCDLEYMLEGFDSDYIAADGINIATYVNLPYRRYKFIVRCASAFSSGDEDAVDVLEIIVRPPLYLSIAAFALYLLLFAVVVVWILRVYYLRRIAVNDLVVARRNYQRDRDYDQAKLSFFTNASHELRTPLTLMSGQLECVLDETKSDSSTYRRVQQAFNITKKLRMLVDGLSDMRKQQNGYAIMLFKRESVVDIVSEVFDSYRDLASYRGMEYLLSIDSDGPIMAMCDRNEIEKVVFNIVTNAFKFTTGGFISVELSTCDGDVVLEVRDNGIGIEPENKDRIFDRFFQEHRGDEDSEVTRGVGIGLWMSKSIIEAHGGTIEVDSVLGEGSCFRVVFPIGDVDGDEVSGDDEDYGDGMHDLSFKVIKESILFDSEASVEEILNSLNDRVNGVDDSLILVVADYQPMQAFLVDLFSRYYRVESASSAEMGYRKAIELQPSLIISDVVMAEASGVDMCARIKSNFHINHIPVVLLAEQNSLDKQIEGFEKGADAYIVKPFSVKFVLARVENILESRRVLSGHTSEGPVVTMKQLFTPAADDEEFLSRAFNIVLDNVSNVDYSVDQFASDMFMGRTTFFKRLKQAVDLTPNEFILTVRLKRAVEMLKSPSNFLIADIADKCGFNSQQYFCSCFKRKFGVSPAQYAKEGASKRVEHPEK